MPKSVEKIHINSIPTLVWGESSEKVIVAVHGNLSNKADEPISILAEIATLHDYQVLSFDLPEHGERKTGKTPCKVQNCVEELKAVINYAREKWQFISLFGVSMGAYFSLLACHKLPIKHAWFLSPVIDMEKIIQNMMKASSVSEEQLEREQTIQTPFGETLYWDYLVYVRNNCIEKWDIPTDILFGENDDVCDTNITKDFSERFDCSLTTVSGAEHWFHTPEQLNALRRWLENKVQ